MHTNQIIGNYWIKAKGWADCGVNQVYQTAVLKYEENTNLKKMPDINNLNYSSASREGLVI